MVDTRLAEKIATEVAHEYARLKSLPKNLAPKRIDFNLILLTSVTKRVSSGDEIAELKSSVVRIMAERRKRHVRFYHHN
jgi:hypothetical protein